MMFLRLMVKLKLRNLRGCDEQPVQSFAMKIEDLNLDRKTLAYIRSYQPNAKAINAAYERAKKAVEG